MMTTINAKRARPCCCGPGSGRTLPRLESSSPTSADIDCRSFRVSAADRPNTAPGPPRQKHDAI